MLLEAVFVAEAINCFFGPCHRLADKLRVDLAE
jgi:hypothetical protein